MNNIENHLHTYDGARIVMTSTGELLIALEIHASSDITRAMEIDLNTELPNISMSFIEPMGYLIYHPELVGGMTVCFISLDLFTDLGEI